MICNALRGGPDNYPNLYGLIGLSFPRSGGLKVNGGELYLGDRGMDNISDSKFSLILEWHQAEDSLIC